MKVRTEHHRIVDLPVEGGSTLRVARIPGEGGEGGRLFLAFGFGNGEGFHRPAWSDALIQVPDSAIPDLRRALDALEAAPSCRP